MARVAIVTDSSADLTPDMRASGRVTVIPAPLAAIRGRVATLHDAEGQPEAPPPALVDSFVATFSELANDHDAVVAVLLSSRLGGIVEAALQARERLAGFCLSKLSIPAPRPWDSASRSCVAPNWLDKEWTPLRLRRHCGPRSIVTMSSFPSRASSTYVKVGRSDALRR